MAVTQSETDVIERKLRIEASPETIFPFFTAPEKMLRWMGKSATLDPRPGGVFSLNVIADHLPLLVPDADHPITERPVRRNSTSCKIALNVLSLRQMHEGCRESYYRRQERAWRAHCPARATFARR